MEIKKIATTVLIAVLIPIFLALFIDAIYPEPDYEDYCKFVEIPPRILDTDVECTYDYGPEYEECINNEGTPRYDYDTNGCQTYKECDYCSRDYNQERDIYNRNVFLIFAILGLIIVVAGVYIKTDFMGAGLMFGGLITLFYSSIRYFSEVSKLLRAIVILIDLLVIIYIGYRKLDPPNNSKKH